MWVIWKSQIRGEKGWIRKRDIITLGNWLFKHWFVSSHQNNVYTLCFEVNLIRIAIQIMHAYLWWLVFFLQVELIKSRSQTILFHFVSHMMLASSYTLDLNNVWFIYNKPHMTAVSVMNVWWGVFHIHTIKHSNSTCLLWWCFGPTLNILKRPKLLVVLLANLFTFPF